MTSAPALYIGISSQRTTVYIELTIPKWVIPENIKIEEVVPSAVREGISSVILACLILLEIGRAGILFVKIRLNSCVGWVRWKYFHLLTIILVVHHNPPELSTLAILIFT